MDELKNLNKLGSLDPFRSLLFLNKVLSKGTKSCPLTLEFSVTNKFQSFQRTLSDF